MLNNFYFENDAVKALRQAGYDPLYFDKNTVRVETNESPHWFYHVCYYLDLLSMEVEF